MSDDTTIYGLDMLLTGPVTETQFNGTVSTNTEPLTLAGEE